MSKVITHGYTAVPRDPDRLKEQYAKSMQPPSPVLATSIDLPNTLLVSKIKDYAHQQLPTPTFNHSMRTFLYGRVMQTEHFPQWSFSDETYMLCCLLHDIGTTPGNLHATLMSFEFYGGMLAHNLLLQENAEKAQAEAVMEAIIRHQDVGKEGTITAVGQLLQLAV